MAKYVDIASVCTIIGNLLSIPYDFDRPITMDDVNESIDEIKSLPSADVVEREKINKTIEVITRLRDSCERMITEEASVANECYEQYANCYNECLKLLNEI